jgi:hypothetical protein
MVHNATNGTIHTTADSRECLTAPGFLLPANITFLQLLERIRPQCSDISSELLQMRTAAARAATAGKTSQRLATLAKQYKPELVASMLWPLVLMLTGLNVLSTWTPNLLMALGAESAFALRSNTVMMAVGLVAALMGELVS